jgi:hypothetical protein
MRRSYIALAVGIVLAFLSGVAVGQKAQVSKFAKYRAPANVSVLDWMLLQADMMAVRDHVLFDQSGIAPARFFFDPKPDEITAKVLVDGNFLGKQQSASVKGNLLRTAQGIYTDLNISMYELKEQNFEVEYKNLSGNGPVDFGEYRNGELVLH